MFDVARRTGRVCKRIVYCSRLICAWHLLVTTTAHDQAQAISVPAELARAHWNGARVNSPRGNPGRSSVVGWSRKTERNKGRVYDEHALFPVPLRRSFRTSFFVVRSCRRTLLVACQQPACHGVIYPNSSQLLISSPVFGSTPSVPNYKSFQEFWRVKQSQSLTKIIKRNIKIYDIK